MQFHPAIPGLFGGVEGVATLTVGPGWRHAGMALAADTQSRAPPEQEGVTATRATGCSECIDSHSMTSELAQLCNPTAEGSSKVAGLLRFFGACIFVTSPRPQRLKPNRFAVGKKDHVNTAQSFSLRMEIIG